MQLHKRKAQAVQEFEQWAHSYDRSVLNFLIFRPSHRIILQKLRRRAHGSTSPFRILDIGCGTGTFLAACLATGLSVQATGLDLSYNMVRNATLKADAIQFDSSLISFAVGDAEHLPFESGYFDMVTSSNSFHHYPHQLQAVREMRRVLKADGQLIIVDGHRDDPLGYLIYDIYTTAVEKDIGYCSRRRFTKLLKEAGFHKVTQNMRGLFPPLLTITGQL